MKRKWAKGAKSGGEEEEEREEEEEVGVKAIGGSVYFHSEVSRKSVLEMIRCMEEATNHVLRHLTGPVSEATVYMYIHSEGGDAYAGLSAMDHIRKNRVPVTTIADGFVASAATFMLLGGEYRMCHKHSSLLIHQLSTGFWGKYAELIDEVKNSQQLMETIKSVYSERTSMSQKKLDKLLGKELTLNSEQCLSYGFVEEVY